MLATSFSLAAYNRKKFFTEYIILKSLEGTDGFQESFKEKVFSLYKTRFVNDLKTILGEDFKIISPFNVDTYERIQSIPDVVNGVHQIATLIQHIITQEKNIDLLDFRLLDSCLSNVYLFAAPTHGGKLIESLKKISSSKTTRVIYGTNCLDHPLTLHRDYSAHLYVPDIGNRRDFTIEENKRIEVSHFKKNNPNGHISETRLFEKCMNLAKKFNRQIWLVPLIVFPIAILLYLGIIAGLSRVFLGVFNDAYHDLSNMSFLLVLLYLLLAGVLILFYWVHTALFIGSDENIYDYYHYCPRGLLTALIVLVIGSFFLSWQTSLYRWPMLILAIAIGVQAIFHQRRELAYCRRYFGRERGAKIQRILLTHSGNYLFILTIIMFLIMPIFTNIVAYWFMTVGVVLGIIAGIVHVSIKTPFRLSEFFDF